MTHSDSPSSTQTTLPGVKLEAIITPISSGLKENLEKAGVIEPEEKNEENIEKIIKMEEENSQGSYFSQDYEPVSRLIHLV